MEVQNANLNIRIPLKLRERFVEVANNNGLTHSVVLCKSRWKNGYV